VIKKTISISSSLFSHIGAKKDREKKKEGKDEKRTSAKSVLGRRVVSSN